MTSAESAARFLSEDPVGLAGGVNLYTFGGGDPVNRRDASGLTGCEEGVIGYWEEVIFGYSFVIIGGDVVATAPRLRYDYHICQNDDNLRGHSSGSRGQTDAVPFRLAGLGAPGSVGSPIGPRSSSTLLTPECERSLVQMADFALPLGSLPPLAGANVGLELAALHALGHDIQEADVAGWRKGVAWGVFGLQVVTVFTGSAAPLAIGTSFYEFFLTNLSSYMLSGTNALSATM